MTKLRKKWIKYITVLWWSNQKWEWLCKNSLYNIVGLIVIENLSSNQVELTNRGGIKI